MRAPFDALPDAKANPKILEKDVRTDDFVTARNTVRDSRPVSFRRQTIDLPDGKHF